jgi:putative serine protease PepD
MWKYLLVAVVGGVVGAALAVTGVLLLDDDQVAAPGATVVERVQTEIVSPSDETVSTAAAVARRVLPAIVTVEVRESTVGEFLADGSGSGVVLDTDGLLITNQHVVDGANEVRVVFADGRSYAAEIVGEDALTDLAVLRIAAEDLTAVELGSSEDLEIGDTAIAIGSPLGLGGGPSVTVGVVSAFERRVQTSIDSELFGMLQTDAPITRGSSGGALVDSTGRLIGITTAIGVSDVGAEGLGFAIPVELVIRITDDIIEDGTATHAFLGIRGSTYFNTGADGAVVPAGVEIASIEPDTAAAAAGLAAGDVIATFDGEPLTTMEQLVVRIRFFRVGDSVELEIDRAGERITLTVDLLERPEGL